MRIDDRKLGYALILFLVVFGLTLAGYLYYLFHFGYYELTVVFPNLGILAIDDAVKVHGKQVGRVKSIERREEAAWVVLEMTHPLTLHADYVINERDRGLMGDREIEIDPGRSEALADRTRPLQGRFIPGIAESMAMANNLKLKTSELANLVHRFAAGDSGKKSFPVQFRQIMHKTESLSRRMEELADEIAPPINRTADGLSRISRDARKISSATLQSSQKYLGTADSLLARTPPLLVKLSAAADSIDLYSRRLRADTAFVGKTLQDVSFLDTLASTLEDLQKMLSEMKHKGHLNINLF